MTVPQTITEELQKVAPSSIIELFELQLVQALHGSADIYRFHAGVNAKNDGGSVVWAGQAFQAFPVECEGFEYSGNGQLPRPKLRVANVLGTITTVLLAVNAVTPGNDLIGAKVIRRRTLARYLDAVNFPGNLNPYGTPDPTAEFPQEIYFISRKVSENRDLVEFELAAAFDLQGVRAPKRQCISNVCQWRYRRWNAATSSFDYTGVDCPYTGGVYYDDDDNPTGNPALDVCGKRLSSCAARFERIQVTGRVTAGSNVITDLSTTELNQIGIGEPIVGFGLPAGTTVAAKSSTSLTVSVNATGTSVVSGSGELVTSGLAITMGSVTGILPGMVVTGPWVPTGTTVSAVNTSTKVVTLSITFNPNMKDSEITKTGAYTVAFDFVNGYTYNFAMEDPSGIEVGDYVDSPFVYADTTVTAVTGTLVRLSRAQVLVANAQVTAEYYQRIAVPGAQTYTFTASQAYAVRADSSLPFGSFPGVGSYTL